MAKMTTQQFIQNIRDLIAKDDLTTAIAGLKELLDHTPRLNEVLQQSGRFENIQKQIRLGTVSHSEANLTQNQIRAGLLDLVSEMEQQDKTATLRAEIERAISSIVNSKNVVVGSAISAGGNVHIGDIIQQMNAHAKPPHQLTTPGAAVPEGFIGRERELGGIHTRLHAGGNALALVNAEGGMGKTTLAAAYWKRFSGEYQHLAWLFCEKGILEAMRSILPEPLGLREKMNEVAADTDKQMRLIISSMANLPKNCLLVLDNANDPAHIQGFERDCAGLGWHVLITSRCAGVLTDAGAEYPIRSLPPDEAKQLFRSHYDEKTPAFEALLDRFLLAVGHNTLCIEVFSKTLREGSGGWGDLDFEKLLQKLEENGLKLGADSFEIKTHWTQNLRSEAANSDQIIQALYDVSRLTDEAGELLARFCLLPAASHEAPVLVALLSPDDKQGLKRGLDQLAQKGWLSAEANTYRVSPVVQKIVLHQYADRRWALGEDLVARLNGIFETEGYHSKNIETAKPFAELAPGLVDNLATANVDLANLYHGLWVYHTATGNLAQALQMAEKMRFLCESSDDKYNLGRAYENLGSTHTALGNLPKALTFFEDETKLEKELHDSYPQNVDFKNGLAISYSKLGETHTALGNLPKALTFFEKDIELSKELHDSYPQNVDFKNNLAISYSKLGSTHTALGNLPKALTFFEAYHRLEKELHDSYPQNVDFKNGLAISNQNLGHNHTSLGNLAKALTFFEAYNRLEKELHDSYPQNVSFKNGLAISYEKLGSTHTALGNLPKALTF
ncbi:MAG: tetratricopeptide repeat protein [Haliscomenobacter sp.]|nr:tetratricopeptide repeat protein [Haliscomenobacter sp.]